MCIALEPNSHLTRPFVKLSFAPPVFASRSEEGTRTVEIKLDVHKLLSGLMEQAAHVVTSVAEIASSTLTTVSMPRSASFLAMPPPDPRSPQRKKASLGLELLSRAASALPIVSPDSRRAVSSDSNNVDQIPSLRLEIAALSLPPCEDDDVEDVATFSPDQCADIVDSIFGDVDDSVFNLVPPRKKARAA